MIGFPKPVKGSGLLASRQRRAVRRAAEQAAMRAALVRDGRKCRWPNCEFKSLNMPIDAAHLVHRGMGGNPVGDRSNRNGIVALCRSHHGAYDASLIDLQPISDDGTDGRLAFYRKHPQTGQFMNFFTEPTR